MMDHPDQLYAVEFTEADQVRLVGFSCGDELWSRHVTEWILGSDVFDSMGGVALIRMIKRPFPE